MISGSVCLAMTPEAALASAAELKRAAEALLQGAPEAPREERSWVNRDTEQTRLT